MTSSPSARTNAEGSFTGQLAEPLTSWVAIPPGLLLILVGHLRFVTDVGITRSDFGGLLSGSITCNRSIPFGSLLHTRHAPISRTNDALEP